jgi:hypothetical protein
MSFLHCVRLDWQAQALPGVKNDTLWSSAIGQAFAPALTGSPEVTKCAPERQ